MTTPGHISVLILSPDNISNTNIIDNDDGKVLYHVATEYNPHKTVTRIENCLGQTIASWEWRDLRSDLITFGSSQPVSVSTWLRKSVLPFNKDVVTFQDHDRKTYKWKGIAPGLLPLELYSDDDKRNPIARFQKSGVTLNRLTNPPTPQTRPAALLVDNRGQQILDLIVISFLLLERSRRPVEGSNMPQGSHPS